MRDAQNNNRKKKAFNLQDARAHRSLARTLSRTSKNGDSDRDDDNDGDDDDGGSDCGCGDVGSSDGDGDDDDVDDRTLTRFIQRSPSSFIFFCVFIFVQIFSFLRAQFSQLCAVYVRWRRQYFAHFFSTFGTNGVRKMHSFCASWPRRRLNLCTA